MNIKRIPVCLVLAVVLSLTGCGPAAPSPAPTQTAIPLSPEQASDLLLESAKSNDLPGVVAALEQGADVNAMSKQGVTPLMGAALNGHADLVALLAAELLVEQGIDLNVRDNGGHTALYWANFRNQPEIAALISAAGGTEWNIRKKSQSTLKSPI